ncbi:DUF4352 domain-containing protein [Streptomyces sp. NPDC088252]|uniref:DUF4352 domain-containing protein n=1 Tax=Streptomyces sp. NPDC088252 TaxID=3365845 RepID=UPI003814BDE4
MSQHNPGQPQWGPQQPQAYGMPPQQPKKSSKGKIFGLGCLGIIVLFILIGIIAAVIGGGDSKDENTKSGNSSSTAQKDEKPQGKKEEKAPADSPIEITATPTKFSPGVFHGGGEYTSVKVTITNNSGKKIGVNPLYFAITDKSGSKHTAELAVDENQMDTTDLASGENITGVITGKGKFDAAYVTYTDGLIGDSVKGDVK